MVQLGTADDGVVYKQQLLVLNELGNGNLLHFGHLVADLLVGRHKGAGPGGGIFDEGAGKVGLALVGVADGVGDAGVGNAGHIVHIGTLAALFLIPGHDGAVAVAHELHIDPFIVGVGIAVVGPQEGADLHFLAG